MWEYNFSPVEATDSMNIACLHLNRSSQSTRCFLRRIKICGVEVFFHFLVAIPRPMYRLSSNNTIKWMVNNHDFIELWFTQANDQKNICKMRTNRYFLQWSFKKDAKEREIGKVLRYWWTGLHGTPNHKKNCLVYMLCRWSTSQLQSGFHAGALAPCWARAAKWGSVATTAPGQHDYVAPGSDLHYVGQT